MGPVRARTRRPRRLQSEITQVPRRVVATALGRIQEPGIEITCVFRLVTGDVLRATANRQRPFVYGSLPGEDEYYFKLR